jgi:hypothetical protein
MTLSLLGTDSLKSGGGLKSCARAWLERGNHVLGPLLSAARCVEVERVPTGLRDELFCVSIVRKESRRSQR